MTHWRACQGIIVFSALFSFCAGCGSGNGVPQDLSPGIAIKQPEMDGLHQELAAKVGDWLFDVDSLDSERRRACVPLDDQTLRRVDCYQLTT
jgi:hypothetical protein